MNKIMMFISFIPLIVGVCLGLYLNYILIITLGLYKFVGIYIAIFLCTTLFVVLNTKEENCER